MFSLTRRFLVPAAVVAACTLACDARTSAHGTVSEPGGGPISGASVELSAAPSFVREDLTQSDGSFQLGRTHGFGGGRMALTISKKGYKAFRVELAPRAAYSCRITLALATAATESLGDCSVVP